MIDTDGKMFACYESGLIVYTGTDLETDCQAGVVADLYRVQGLSMDCQI